MWLGFLTFSENKFLPKVVNRENHGDGDDRDG